jgi:hypothetical protein
MSMTKSHKRLLLLLLIAVGYAGYDLISNSDQYTSLLGFLFSKKKSGNSNITSNIKPDSVKEDTTKNIIMDWKRDPFFSDDMIPPPKIIKKIPEVKLNLNAITFSGENSIVIINNQILKEGQTIEGYVIEKIFLNKVRLSKPGKTIFLEQE